MLAPKDFSLGKENGSYRETRRRRHEANPAWKKAKEEVIRKLHQGRNVYIYGGSGTGKTTILEVVSQEFLEEGKSIGTPGSVFPVSSPDEVYGRLARAIENAMGIERGIEGGLMFKKRRFTEDLRAIRKSHKTPIVILDRLYSPPFWAAPHTHLMLSKGIKRIIRAGGQILAACREPLEETFPSLVSEFDEINLGTKQAGIELAENRWVYVEPMFGRKSPPVSQGKIRTIQSAETVNGEIIYTVGDKRGREREVVLLKK
jgi:energy-coupling factor transporter ATP-binding protein EcfA2